VVQPRPGDANIDYVSVKLPPTELLDQAHIGTVCSRVQFAAEQCPANSVYGKVSVTSPLVDYPLSGNVYLRASSNKLPDLVVDLHGPASQPIRIEAAGKIDTVKGALRATFEFVPDVPFTKLKVALDGRKKGLLINSRNFCKVKRNRAEVKIGSHNAESYTIYPVVGAKCGGKGKKGSK
jgi:hypothetical protein